MEAYLNHKFVPLELATLHVSDLAIQRGYGIFDFFRVKEFVPLFLDSYLDRFYRSSSIMGLQGVMDRESLRAVIHELIRRNAMPDAGMKLIFTGGYSPDAYQPVEGNFLISEHALVLPTPAQVEKGIKVITHPYRRDIPEVKTINYIMGVWLQKKVKEAGAADVLYHQDNEVSEFPRCNFFMVTRDGALITPKQHILHGITRMNVLKAAANLMKVEERPVTLDDLSKAQEVFLTSTTKRILPIVQIDSQVVGDGKPGPVAEKLYKCLEDLELHEVERAKSFIAG